MKDLHIILDLISTFGKGLNSIISNDIFWIYFLPNQILLGFIYTNWNLAWWSNGPNDIVGCNIFFNLNYTKNGFKGTKG